MITLSVLYPKSADSTFDHAYYRDTHIPLVKSLLEPESVTILQGIPGLDGATPAFELMVLLAFQSTEQLAAALAAHGPEVVGDVPNFTNIHPILQLNQPE